MDVMRWRFTRGDEVLAIERHGDTDDDLTLSITTGSAEPRLYRFADERACVRFQADMESLLVSTGWVLSDFEPERRRGRDRRRFPRIDERRRWWTDPHRPHGSGTLLDRSADRRRR